jgi:hypothetical protein
MNAWFLINEPLHKRNLWVPRRRRQSRPQNQAKIKAPIARVNPILAISSLFLDSPFSLSAPTSLDHSVRRKSLRGPRRPPRPRFDSLPAAASQRDPTKPGDSPSRTESAPSASISPPTHRLSSAYRPQNPQDLILLVLLLVIGGGSRRKMPPAVALLPLRGTKRCSSKVAAMEGTEQIDAVTYLRSVPPSFPSVFLPFLLCSHHLVLWFGAGAVSMGETDKHDGDASLSLVRLPELRGPVDASESPISTTMATSKRSLFSHLLLCVLH